DLLLVSHKRDRAFETGRPTGREQLLRIGTDARRARYGKLDIKPAVGAARHAVFATASRMGLRGVNDLVGGFGGALICDLRHGSLLDGRSESSLKGRAPYLVRLMQRPVAAREWTAAISCVREQIGSTPRRRARQRCLPMMQPSMNIITRRPSCSSSLRRYPRDTASAC